MQDKKYIGASITRKKNSRIFHYLEENPMISPSKLVKIAVAKYLDSIGYEVGKVSDNREINKKQDDNSDNVINNIEVNTKKEIEDNIPIKEIEDDITIKDINTDDSTESNTDELEEVNTNGDVEM